MSVGELLALVQAPQDPIAAAAAELLAGLTSGGPAAFQGEPEAAEVLLKAARRPATARNRRGKG